MSAATPNVIDDDEFWAARANPRKAILGILVIVTFSLMSLDYTSSTVSIYGILLAVPVLSLICVATLSNLRLKQNIFSYSIALASFLSMLHFLQLAMGDFDLSRFPHNSDKSLMLRMHKQGQLPAPILIVIALPGLATPAGMSVRVAKNVSIANFLVLGAIIAAVYDHIGKAGACPNTNDETGHLELMYSGFIQDIINVLSTFSISLFACVPGAEVSETHMQMLRAGRMADSLLNHILKNQIAGAAAVIEIFLQKYPETKDELQGACDEMYRSMRWCAVRQTMMDLAAGVYVSTVTPVHIRKFLEGVRSPAATFEISVNVQTGPSGASIGKEIHFDEKMALLALENAISNAVAHGQKNSPITLTASVVKETVVFTVENIIPPGVVLTNDLLQTLIHTPSFLFDRSVSKQEFQTSASLENKVNSTKSGLKHVSLACKGAGGHFEMVMGQEKTSVIACLVFPAKQVERTTSEPRDAPLVDPKMLDRDSPNSNLIVCCLDDMKMICKSYTKLLLPLMLANMKHSSVVCPKTLHEIDSFLDHVIGGGDDLCPADIVILDQNIDLFGGTENVTTVLGTDLALKLRARGFKGLIVLRTGNSSLHDVQAYMASGAVDECIGKDGNHRDLAALIFAAFSQHKICRSSSE